MPEVHIVDPSRPEGVSLGDSRRYGGLTVYPLVTALTLDLPYRLLAEVLKAGTLRIREVGGGTVPELIASNAGKLPVLIVDGEQLVGAKQNRMTNRSLLLAPESETRIPVSCMERGRWSWRSPDIRATAWHSPAAVRVLAKSVEAGAVAGGYEAGPSVLSGSQRAVWSEIERQADRLDARSGTSALDEVYASRREDLDEWAVHFPRLERQVGLLVFRRERVIGLDVIGAPALYAKLHDRLLRGYIMDVLGTAADAAGPAAGEAASFLADVREARRAPAPTAGIGEYSVLSGRVVGGALVHEGALVHLCAFPTAEDGDLDRARRPVYEPELRGPSARRRNRIED